MRPRATAHGAGRPPDRRRGARRGSANQDSPGSSPARNCLYGSSSSGIPYEVRTSRRNAACAKSSKSRRKAGPLTSSGTAHLRSVVLKQDGRHDDKPLPRLHLQQLSDLVRVGELVALNDDVAGLRVPVERRTATPCDVLLLPTNSSDMVPALRCGWTVSVLTLPPGRAVIARNVDRRRPCERIARKVANSKDPLSTGLRSARGNRTSRRTPPTRAGSHRRPGGGDGTFPARGCMDRMA